MKALFAASVVQLALGLAGLRKALKDRAGYDVWKHKGDPAQIEREQWINGTSLSAPGVMLILQALATAGLLSHRGRRASATILGILGAIMSGGYVAEKPVREAWRGRSSDASVMPMTAAGTVLAVSMAVLGWREVRRLPAAGQVLPVVDVAGVLSHIDNHRYAGSESHPLCTPRSTTCPRSASTNQPSAATPASAAPTWTNPSWT